MFRTGIAQQQRNETIKKEVLKINSEEAENHGRLERACRGGGSS